MTTKTYALFLCSPRFSKQLNRLIDAGDERDRGDQVRGVPAAADQPQAAPGTRVGCVSSACRACPGFDSQLTSVLLLAACAGSRHQESLLKAQRQDREQFRGRKVHCLPSATTDAHADAIDSIDAQGAHHADDDGGAREYKQPAPQSAPAKAKEPAAPAGALLELALIVRRGSPFARAAFAQPRRVRSTRRTSSSSCPAATRSPRSPSPSSNQCVFQTPLQPQFGH